MLIKSEFELKKRPGHILYNPSIRSTCTAVRDIPSSYTKGYYAGVKDIFVHCSIIIQESMWAELLRTRIFDWIVENMPTSKSACHTYMYVSECDSCIPGVLWYSLVS